MAAFWTAKAAYTILNAYVGAATLKIMYLQSSLTPLRTHNFVSDVVSAECNVAGYSRQTLANVTVTEDDVNERAKLDADDPVSQTLAAGNTLRHVAVFAQGASDAASVILCFQDMGSNRATTGAAFPVTFSPSGIGRHQA